MNCSFEILQSKDPVGNPLRIATGLVVHGHDRFDGIMFKNNGPYINIMLYYISPALYRKTSRSSFWSSFGRLLDFGRLLVVFWSSFRLWSTFSRLLVVF